MKINIIGSGNVASHLIKAFQDKAEIRHVNPHTLCGFDIDADVSIIAVTDNAIRQVAESLPEVAGIIVHTSGSTPIDALECRKERIGVFYPLQTFTKDVELDYSEIPFLIEAKDHDTELRLLKLAATISDNVRVADSEKRKTLHVASVFACNFVNHLWAISEKLLNENGMEFNIIRPLLKETLRKTEHMSPFDAQTGPAIRRDSKTIDTHLSLLETDRELMNIYQTLTSSIISSHHNKNC